MSQLKLAYVVAAPDLRRDERVTALPGGLAGSFRRLAERGYDGAEIMVGDPDLPEWGSLPELARECRLEIPVLCTGELYGQYGLSFMDPDESVRRRAVETTCQVIDHASRLGAAVNIGRLRGRLRPEVARGTSLGWMYAAFDRISAHAAPRGVILLLEPVAYPFCNLINSTRDGLTAVAKVGRPNFRLMLDVFTMQMEDRSMAEAFREARPRLGHIHLCDSNRLAPGMGIFDFAGIVQAIRESGYRGYVSAEIYQAPDPAIALDRTTAVLLPLVRS